MHLASCTQQLSRLLRVVGVSAPFLSVAGDVPGAESGYLADGRWACFCFPAVMCAAAVNIPMAVRVWTCFPPCWVTTTSGSKPMLTLCLTFCGTIGLLLSSLFNFGQVTPLPGIPGHLSPP